jgi:hypothetical protein
VRVPLTGDEEDLLVHAPGDAFPARPVLRATVSDNTLVVAAVQPGAYPEGLSAYSLVDGQRLWHADLGTDVNSLASVGKGRVAVLGDNDRLWTFTAADGGRVGEDDGTVLRDVGGRIEASAQLIGAGDTWVVVNSDGNGYPPVFAVRP